MAVQSGRITQRTKGFSMRNGQIMVFNVFPPSLSMAIFKSLRRWPEYPPWSRISWYHVGRTATTCANGLANSWMHESTVEAESHLFGSRYPVVSFSEPAKDVERLEQRLFLGVGGESVGQKEEAALDVNARNVGDLGVAVAGDSRTCRPFSRGH